MTSRSDDLSILTYEDRAAIIRRAEHLRAEELGRLFSALAERVRGAMAHFAARGAVAERVEIPRSPSSAIF